MMAFTVIDKETGKAVVGSDLSEDTDEWSAGSYSSPVQYEFAITQSGKLIVVDDWGEVKTCRSDKLEALVRFK